MVFRYHMSLILQSCFFDQTGCQYPANGSVVLSDVFLSHVYRVMQSIVGHSICISMSLINSYSCLGHDLQRNVACNSKLKLFIFSLCQLRVTLMSIGPVYEYYIGLKNILPVKTNNLSTLFGTVERITAQVQMAFSTVRTGKYLSVML